MLINHRSSAQRTLTLVTLFGAACAGAPPAASPPPAHAHTQAPVVAAPAPESTTQIPAEQTSLAVGLCADPSDIEAHHMEEDQSGYLDPNVVRNVVQGGYFSMRECYEEGLARDTNLSGKIQVRFVIDRDGRVSSVRLDDNTLPDCEAARCMLDVYRALEFPEPNGGRVTVVYPLTFTPS